MMIRFFAATLILVLPAFTSLLSVVCAQTNTNQATQSIDLAAKAQAQPKNEYKIGVARVDVTPEHPVRLNGFGFRRKESEGISQRIWAKALAISCNDDKPVVIITVDSLGVRMSMVDQVAEVLKSKFGIERKNVALTFTHSHCTPKVTGSSDHIFGEEIPELHLRNIQRYTKQLTDCLKQVAIKAVENRKPGTLAHGIGKVDFAINRRTRGGPVDHDLPILVARDAEKKIVAIYASYACHCVTLSFNQISGDWAGYAQVAIERQFPGSLSLVSIGAGSDANPDSGVTGDKIEAAAKQGNQIASEMDRVIDQGLRPVTGPITSQLTQIALPLKKAPTRKQLADVGRQKNYHGLNARIQLARLDAGQTLMSQVNYPIQNINFGDDLAIVFLAGEVCVDYAIRLKKELDRSRIWINGYSNDFVGYIPSERLLKEGGYGGGAESPLFDWPAPLKPGMEQKIVDQIKKQVGKKYFVKPGTRGIPPKSPRESLKEFKINKRFRIELAAAEPQVQDPVAIDFGVDGRVWVAEMPDYSRAVNDSFEPRGRIRFLKDLDQDGFFETSQIFATGLRFPMDVKVWRKGILVCDAPDILYFEDTNNDDKADVKKILFSGFATHNPHGRVNSLRIGLDGWVYGSCGLFGGQIKSFNGKTYRLGARDFRIRPDDGELQPVTGTSQQGRVRDDWGNWFGCNNSDLLRHYPWRDEYGTRNRWVVPPSTTRSLGDNGRLFPPDNLVLFRLSGAAGVTTSACGLGIYRDVLLGKDLRGNTFTCEPANQLVHRLVLNERGTSFVAKRPAEEASSEFLISTDQWFRPVQMRTGPDGAIYIVDMYRFVIEHPRWIPEESKRDLDLFAGHERGRIYRILPAKGQPRDLIDFGKLSNTQWIEQLQSPNGTIRDLAFQLLVWSGEGDKKVTAHLERLIANAKSAESRLQALCTLDGMGQLDEKILHSALSDPDASVRRHAVRMAEKYPSSSMASHVSRLHNDKSDLVRLQLAYSLGNFDDVQGSTALAKMLVSEQDPYIIAAILTSVNEHNVSQVFEKFVSLLATANRDAQHQALEKRRMITRIGASLASAESVAFQLGSILDLADRRIADKLVLLAEFLDSIDRRDRSFRFTVSDHNLKRIALLAEAALQSISDDSVDATKKLAAITFLSRRISQQSSEIYRQANVRTDDYGEQLAESFSAGHAPSIQRAVIVGISRIGGVDGAKRLISLWPQASPTLRGQIVESLLSRDQWLVQTLDWVDQGRLSVSDFQADQKRRLIRHGNAVVRKKANDVFQKNLASAANRKTIDAWKSSLGLSADLRNGRRLYEKHCGTCHRAAGDVKAVGPDLAALTHRSKKEVLISIVDPNRDVPRQYFEYQVLLQNGQRQSGLLVEETSASVTLRQKDGENLVLMRNDIDEFTATANSMMPTNLEQDLSQQDMADVIAVVFELGNQPKKFDGNQPKTLGARRDGSFELSASTAEIYGNEIVFESKSPFKNIGYWHEENDFVVWKLRVADPAKYDVWIDYSCHDSSAGNSVIIRAEPESEIAFRVAGTSGWEHYRRIKLGTIQLNRGLRSVSVQPKNQMVKPALLDLRTVLLVPVGKKPAWSDD